MRQAPYVLYETANVHGGDSAALLRLIDALAPLTHPRRGVKFHPIGADTLATPDFSYHPLYRRLELTKAEWAKVINRAAKTIGDVWCEMADSRCAEIFLANKDKIRGVKFQASMVDNEETLGLLRAEDLSGHDALINISGYSLDEAMAHVEAIAALGFRDTIVQIGFQDYPTALGDTMLNKIAHVRSAAPERRICFADHVAGGAPFSQHVPMLAAALGCDMVEKHVCLARDETEFDAFSSLEPAEIEALQETLSQAAECFHARFVSPRERTYLEKSLVKPLLNEDHAPGRLIAPRDVVFRRSSKTGLSMTELSALQSRRLVPAETIPAGEAVSATHFRAARVAVIVACRLKSSRLPKKALLPIAGVPSVERCLENCLLFEGVDEVVLASSTMKEDAELGEYTLGGRVPFRTGDPDDVLRRYLDVVDEIGADVVVRVTADCPLISPEYAELLLREHFARGADFTRVARDPVGTAPHIMSVEAMRRIYHLNGGAPYSEYMNLYFENNPELFKVEIVPTPMDLYRDVRLTLDYPEDLEMFERLYEELEARGQSTTLRNVISLLDEKPEIGAINKDLNLVYKTDKKLIDKLNRETRITPPTRKTNGKAHHEHQPSL